MSTLPSKLFITGTDTDIGKTVVSAMLMAGRGGYYWKPIQSGCRDMTDTTTVQNLTDLAKHRFLPEAYRLTEPLSPHAAAELDGINVDVEAIGIPEFPDGEPLIVEGAGGVMVPLGPGHFMLDLMRILDLPVLVVARSGLGTINHTLLTLSAIRRAGLTIAGVVLNGELNAGNHAAIEVFGNIQVVAEIPPLDDLSPKALTQGYRDFFTV
ncbi:dethiobiotin synthase [Desulfovibrio ferrophilus]|uniref:ATP-dependent dethiobiotin synthetase BioD n=1 Tax=Desulfovibrio ferrophilus TaxID=241368 RepID=A0A2Z6AXS9_9BACT|nr:dethiobiotin synthase [Desulfovibrio ferrophilus]BBD08057.1 ATP-dependent dethiobiotin synthetase BioD [Desulfovibrio ferrophilus]